jgi:hypothetical protein
MENLVRNPLSSKNRSKRATIRLENEWTHFSWNFKKIIPKEPLENAFIFQISQNAFQKIVKLSSFETQNKLLTLFKGDKKHTFAFNFFWKVHGKIGGKRRRMNSTIRRRFGRKNGNKWKKCKHAKLSEKKGNCQTLRQIAIGEFIKDAFVGIFLRSAHGHRDQRHGVAIHPTTLAAYPRNTKCSIQRMRTPTGTNQLLWKKSFFFLNAKKIPIVGVGFGGEDEDAVDEGAGVRGQHDSEAAPRALVDDGLGNRAGLQARLRPRHHLERRGCHRHRGAAVVRIDSDDDSCLGFVFGTIPVRRWQKKLPFRRLVTFLGL